MRILVSGSTGFLGSSLVETLERGGHSVARLFRPGSHSDAAIPSSHKVLWDPLTDQFDASAAEGADALVHLAGASIAERRWTPSRKKLLRTSRIDATKHLIDALSKLGRPPQVIVGASAVGYYGNRGDETLVESSAGGNGFLAEICREWEAEELQGQTFGARVVCLRFGIILAANGGALPRMATPFKLGIGGRLGSGKQWMSWLTLAEAIHMIEFALGHANLSGAVNAVTENPVRNAEFTRALANTLHRPALFAAPRVALRLALGEMADALLFASDKVLPSKFVQAGYKFLQPNLADALHTIYVRS